MKWISWALVVLAMTSGAVAAPKHAAPAAAADSEDDDDMTPAPNLPPVRPKPADPRAALGPKPGRMASATCKPLRLPVEPKRADGKPFTCTAYGLIDVETGQILVGHNLTQRLEPASTTKLLTTLLALEDLDRRRVHLEDLVTISKAAATTPESGLWLQVGEQMTLHDLLVGVMVRSANDAAYAVAEYLGGGDVRKFVARMNQRARELGAIDTHYVNPHGLHVDLDGRDSGGEQHWTTPYDLLLFTDNCWKYPFFRQLCLMDHEPITWQQMPETGEQVQARERKNAKPAPPHPSQRIIPNRNKLLRRYPECVGVKTGYTRQAGACLVSAALRGDRAVLAVTMHSASGEDRWMEAEALLRFGLDEFVRRKVVSAGQTVRDLPVSGGLAATVPAVAGEDVTLLWPKQWPVPQPELEADAALDAPVPAGMALGALVLKTPTGEARRVGLTAGRDVDRSGRLLGPWIGWLGLMLAAMGVVCYGAVAEAYCRGGRVLAPRGGTVDPRGPREAQWARGARAGHASGAD